MKKTNPQDEQDELDLYVRKETLARLRDLVTFAQKNVRERNIIPMLTRIDATIAQLPGARLEQVGTSMLGLLALRERCATAMLERAVRELKNPTNVRTFVERVNFIQSWVKGNKCTLDEIGLSQTLLDGYARRGHLAEVKAQLAILRATSDEKARTEAVHAIEEELSHLPGATVRDADRRWSNAKYDLIRRRVYLNDARWYLEVIITSSERIDVRRLVQSLRYSLAKSGSRLAELKLTEYQLRSHIKHGYKGQAITCLVNATKRDLTQVQIIRLVKRATRLLALAAPLVSPGDAKNILSSHLKTIYA